MMYRAIIVDDEADVREGLQLLTDWESHGFRIVGEASHGAEALEHMPIWRPELIITDIRMPVLDGIEYIRRLRAQFPDMIVVVVSAYGEFHYAQEAIGLGVIDFLLKPITRNDLIDCLNKVGGLLDQRQKQLGKARAERQFMLEKKLQELCHGKLPRPGDMAYIEDSPQMEKGGQLRVLLLELDDYETYVTDLSESDIDLLRFMVRNIAAEIASSRGVVQIYEDSQERIGMLLSSNPQTPPNIEALGGEIRDALLRYVKISVSIGIGKPYMEWSLVRESRHEALQSLEYMLLEGRGGVFQYEQLERSYRQADNKQRGQTSIDIAAILQAIDETDSLRVNEELDLFFDMLRSRAKTPELARGICLELLIGIVRLVREYNGDTGRVFGDRLQEYETVYTKRSLDDLKAWLVALSRRTVQYLSELRAAKLPDVMQEVKTFIDENYAEDISLKMISVQVYKNPAYLGQLFKTTFGESFSQYLTKIRIEKAKELLRKEHLLVYEIAEKVGYVTLDTFYQRFKQLTGMNPTEYKMRLSSGQSSDYL